MKLKIRAYFKNEEDESFMGIGVLWLLEGIEKNGSIRKAAEEMNMSYSKAYQILKKLEDSLNTQIFVRHKGGNRRTGTTLTNAGKTFLRLYKVFNDNIEAYCQREFLTFKKEMEKELI